MKTPWKLAILTALGVALYAALTKRCTCCPTDEQADSPPSGKGPTRPGPTSPGPTSPGPTSPGPTRLEPPHPNRGKTSHDRSKPSPTGALPSSSTAAQRSPRQTGAALPTDLARWGTREGLIEVADRSQDPSASRSLARVREAQQKTYSLPTHLRHQGHYPADLKKWGTRQGLIDVSHDEPLHTKEQRAARRIARQSASVAAHYLYARAQTLRQAGKQVNTPQQLHDALEQDLSLTQVTVQNTSTIERTVTLWEANRATPLSTPLPTDVEDHTVLEEAGIPDAVYPQGAAFNPANGYFYQTYQLSNLLVVLRPDGTPVLQRSLAPDHLPGLNSPVDVAINTNPDSAHYGYAYVIGSVSNTFHIIDRQFRITHTLNVGLRPLAIAFHPLNEYLYLTNYASHTLSVIDPHTLQQTLHPTGTHPSDVAISTSSGHVFVTNTADHSLEVFDQDHQRIRRIEQVGQRPTRMVYHPGTQELLVISSATDAVIPIAADTFQQQPPIPVAKDPEVIGYHPGNDLTYVGSQTSGVLTVITPTKALRFTPDLGTPSCGLAFHPTRHLLYASSAATSTVRIVGFATQTRFVRVDEDYAQKREDFQHQPAIVHHVTFVLSGEQRFRTLRLREGRATGSQTVRTLSFSDYRSPQNIGNVSEVHELAGEHLDGTHGWAFEVAPHQHLTLLVHYWQVDGYALLPETAPIALGGERRQAISPLVDVPQEDRQTVSDGPIPLDDSATHFQHI